LKRLAFNLTGGFRKCVGIDVAKCDRFAVVVICKRFHQLATSIGNTDEAESNTLAGTGNASTGRGDGIVAMTIRRRA